MTFQMVNTDRLRGLLYDMLVGATDPGDQVSVSQQLGVAISAAAQKQGVNIVQLQSLSINKLVVGVTAALKLLDEKPEIALLEEKSEPDSLSLDEIIETELRNAVSLADFLDKIEAKYVQRALEKFETKKEVCNILEIGFPKLQKIEGNIQRLIC